MFISTTAPSSLSINKCAAPTLRIPKAFLFILFAVSITQKSTDHVFPVLQVKGLIITTSKTEATSTEMFEASGQR